MSIEEEYTDVLQNIEAAIVNIYRQRRNLLDYDVEEALNTLILDYKALQQQRAATPHRLMERPEYIYQEVKQICEWRLGRELLTKRWPSGSGAEFKPLQVEEIMACLKRIKKSVQRWNKQGGRQGYLQFIEQYIV
jgi:hypothetical protein